MRTTRNISEQEYDDQLETTCTIKSCGRFTKATTLLEACQWITTEGQARRFRGSLLDSFSASAFLAVHKALSPEAKEKLESLADKNPLRAISICFQLLK